MAYYDAFGMPDTDDTEFQMPNFLRKFLGDLYAPKDQQMRAKPILRDQTDVPPIGTPMSDDPNTPKNQPDSKTLFTVTTDGNKVTKSAKNMGDKSTAIETFDKTTGDTKKSYSKYVQPEDIMAQLERLQGERHEAQSAMGPTPAWLPISQDIPGTAYGLESSVLQKQQQAIPPGGSPLPAFNFPSQAPQDQSGLGKYGGLLAGLDLRPFQKQWERAGGGPSVQIDPLQRAMKLKKLRDDPYDKAKLEYTKALTAGLRRKAKSEGAGLSWLEKLQWKTKMDIMKSRMGKAGEFAQKWWKTKTVINTGITESAYRKILAAGKMDPNVVNDKGRGVYDMTLIFNYMKMIDPGSTVREGEYATAEQTRGLDDAIVTLWDKIMDGTKLSLKQRRHFLKSAREQAVSQFESLRGHNKKYQTQATGLGYGNLHLQDFSIFDIETDEVSGETSPPGWMIQFPGKKEWLNMSPAEQGDWRENRAKQVNDWRDSYNKYLKSHGKRRK